MVSSPFLPARPSSSLNAQYTVEVLARAPMTRDAVFLVYCSVIDNEDNVDNESRELPPDAPNALFTALPT